RLCARGVNGYTLDDTGQQPQNNAVGTIWWDDVSLHEPESTAEELKARGVKPIPQKNETPTHRLEAVDPGECRLGENELAVTFLQQNGAGQGVWFVWDVIAPSGKKTQFVSKKLLYPDKAGRLTVRVPYVLKENCSAYEHFRGTLTVAAGWPSSVVLGSTEVWFSTWTTPIDLHLGALYLRPKQKQLVRINLGLPAETMKQSAMVRLEIVRRGSGEVLKTQEVSATLAAIEAQRAKIPKELRGDFTNLVLAELDVGFLPVQPFNDPQRNWFVRASM